MKRIVSRNCDQFVLVTLQGFSVQSNMQCFPLFWVIFQLSRGCNLCSLAIVLRARTSKFSGCFRCFEGRGKFCYGNKVCIFVLFCRFLSNCEVSSYIVVGRLICVASFGQFVFVTAYLRCVVWLVCFCDGLFALRRLIGVASAYLRCVGWLICVWDFSCRYINGYLL